MDLWRIIWYVASLKVNHSRNSTSALTSLHSHFSNDMLTTKTAISVFACIQYNIVMCEFVVRAVPDVFWGCWSILQDAWWWWINSYCYDNIASSSSPHTTIKLLRLCQHCLAVSSPELLWSNTKMESRVPWSSSLKQIFAPKAAEVQTKQPQHIVCCDREKIHPKIKLISFSNFLKKKRKVLWCIWS